MSDFYKDHNLTDDEVTRYGRQMITSSFGVGHQEKLKKCAVLVIGCGGLGNPVALYLAGAGIGKLGLVDFDTVDVSNLHRQIAFTKDDVGKKKTETLKDAVLARNPNVEVEVYDIKIDKDNIADIVKEYTVVADCSDNMPARYTINEACVLTKTPLASGSAVGWSGQFTFYHIRPDGPCYRCIYPNPSSNSINMSCSEKGIMGPVVGMIGNLQAIEIIKFCAFGRSCYSDMLYHYDAFESKFITVKLRDHASPKCESCVNLREINDYVSLCNKFTVKSALIDKVPPADRITAQQLHDELEKDDKAVLIDVRPINEFQIAHHPRATNVPIENFIASKGGLQTVSHLCRRANEPYHKCFLICRRGNDSYRALLLLKAHFHGSKAFETYDVIGGYEAWRKDIDSNYPIY